MRTACPSVSDEEVLARPGLSDHGPRPGPDDRPPVHGGGVERRKVDARRDGLGRAPTRPHPGGGRGAAAGRRQPTRPPSVRRASSSRSRGDATRLRQTGRTGTGRPARPLGSTHAGMGMVGARSLGAARHRERSPSTWSSRVLPSGRLPVRSAAALGAPLLATGPRRRSRGPAVALPAAATGAPHAQDRGHRHQRRRADRHRPRWWSSGWTLAADASRSAERSGRPARLGRAPSSRAGDRPRGHRHRGGDRGRRPPPHRDTPRPLKGSERWRTTPSGSSWRSSGSSS